MQVIARLKPGVMPARAQAEMDAITVRLEQQYPNDNTNLRADVIPLHKHLTGGVRRALWIMLGVVGCVLLIACANVANLLLARAAARQSEMAVRTALGANRWQLIRQLLTECMVLSLGGGLLGLLLAYKGVALLTGLSVTSVPRADEIGISPQVLVFTLLISVLTGVVFGIVPAFRASQIELTEALKEGKKGAAGGLRHRRLLGALALVLLTGAGLMIRSFRSVIKVDPGFDPRNVLALSVPLPQAYYKDQAQQLQFYERALAKIQALPGVQAAAGTFRIPLTTLATVIFTVQGKPSSAGQVPSADYRAVSHDYHRTMGIRITKGRAFNERDNRDAPDVVIINEELARRYWPGEDPLGNRLQVGTELTRWREVVGVTANAKMTSLEAPTDPAIYVPFPHNSWPNALRLSSIAVRTSGDPRGVIPAIRQEVRSIDPSLPITQIRTMEEIMANSISQRRFNTALLVLFALVAGVLSAVGIYGVMSYTVRQRTHEVGIRMALGAQRSEIVRMVTGNGAKLALLGIGVGIGAAAVATRLMTSLLFSVAATDPLTFVAVSLLLAAVTLLASYVPARRAAATDPMTALRYD
jgi:putative ABC transport system permease protein